MDGSNEHRVHPGDYPSWPTFFPSPSYIQLIPPSSFPLILHPFLGHSSVIYSHRFITVLHNSPSSTVSSLFLLLLFFSPYPVFCRFCVFSPISYLELDHFCHLPTSPSSFFLIVHFLPNSYSPSFHLFFILIIVLLPLLRFLSSAMCPSLSAL